MALSKLTFLAKTDFTETRAASGLNPARTDPLNHQAGGTMDKDTYNGVKRAQITIDGGANTTLDLYAAFTSYSGNTKTGATKLAGILFETSGVEATAQLKIEPGASNPAPFGLNGTTPDLTYSAGDWIAIGKASHFTLSNTAKNIKLSNPGSTTITVKYEFILGGGTDT